MSQGKNALNLIRMSGQNDWPAIFNGNIGFKRFTAKLPKVGDAEIRETDPLTNEEIEAITNGLESYR